MHFAVKNNYQNVQHCLQEKYHPVLKIALLILTIWTFVHQFHARISSYTVKKIPLKCENCTGKLKDSTISVF